MSRKSESPEAQQAVRYLLELLKLSPYRQVWHQSALMTRAQEGDIHHSAVAQVLANYLHRDPREDHPDDQVIKSKQLEPVISRAFSRGHMSSQTLHLFIKAFRIKPDEAARLWRFYEGTDTVRLLADPPVVPEATTAHLRPGRHRTHAVYEHHYLGEDRRPYRHETLQVIEATADGLDRHAFAFDTQALTVEALMGGTIPDPIYPVSSDIYAVDIMLTSPLTLRERCVLRYETTFRYASLPKPEFRRAVTIHKSDLHPEAVVSIDSLELRVTFHPKRRPRQIWWAVWKDVEGDVADLEPVCLDDYFTAARYQRQVSNSIVGFTWEW
jgi:hypothetical protein